MRILLLSNPSSPHTIKWANSLAAEGIEVYVFGLEEYDSVQYNKNVTINIINISSDTRLLADGAIQKLIYLKALPALRYYIKKVNPDILHAHYASSYGLIGALTGFRPYFISVWGNDVFDFPHKSFFHSKVPILS